MSETTTATTTKKQLIRIGFFAGGRKPGFGIGQDGEGRNFVRVPLEGQRPLGRRHVHPEGTGTLNFGKDENFSSDF